MVPPTALPSLQKAIHAHRSGQLDAASNGYAQVRRINPRSFDAWHLGGMVELQREHPAEAVNLLLRARSIDPRHALCAMRLGLALHASGRIDAGLEALETAARLDAKSPEIWFHLGAVRQSVGRPADARYAWERALQLRPHFAEAHDRIGTQLLDRDGPSAALPHLRAATLARPDWAQSWCNLALALIAARETAEAFAALDRTLQLEPNLSKAHTARGLLLQQTYHPAEAASAFATALALNPLDCEAHSGRLLTLHYLDGIHPAKLAAEHLAAGAALTAALPAHSSPTAPRADAHRLRLAFVSPDLRRHAVAAFIAPLLRHLDRSEFEIFLYHDHALEDEVSADLRTLADQWRNISGQPHAQVATQLRADAPDIAIDLTGHTGINRLAVFAQRVAPAQINYLGYPDSTGVPAMDFRFVDAHSDPAPHADAWASESLVRWSETAWCYEPPADAPPVAALPSADADRPITFGSFNNYAKVSDATVALWSQIVNATAGARLLLKSAGFDQPAIVESVRQRFAAHGLSGERLILRSRTIATTDHLAAYGEIDIALDPLPYHGTTTTCEALWMGRPVITLAGDRHANRVGVSLLTAVGHPEWIAHDPAEFVRIATNLAADRPQLIAASTNLRSRVAASPLLDHVGQAQRFAAALRHCARGQALPVAA